MIKNIYYQIKIIEPGENPKIKGVRFGSKFSCLEKAKVFANNLINDSALKGKKYVICIFDIETRKIYDFYSKNLEEWELSIEQSSNFILESEFKEAFSDLGLDFSIEDETINYQINHISKKNECSNNSKNFFLNKDILKLKKKFLK